MEAEHEQDKGRLDAEVLLDGMLANDRLLDLVENFILFDESSAGGTRKVVARNHQVLGVNNAVAVERQEELKREFPPERRLVEYRVSRTTFLEAAEPPENFDRRVPAASEEPQLTELPLVERAHPDLGRLGVFWHTQGSGKSYSMAFFAEKVRRKVPGNFTFLLMTDRHDLDNQIYKTFVGCGVADEEDAARRIRATTSKSILKENHRFIFSLIHKFNQDVNPTSPTASATTSS